MCQPCPLLVIYTPTQTPNIKKPKHSQRTAKKGIHFQSQLLKSGWRKDWWSIQIKGESLMGGMCIFSSLTHHLWPPNEWKFTFKLLNISKLQIKLTYYYVMPFYHLNVLNDYFQTRNFSHIGLEFCTGMRWHEEAATVAQPSPCSPALVSLYPC